MSQALPNTLLTDNGSTPMLADARIDGDTIVVSWTDGMVSAFHQIWLRDHCPSGLHPSTRERLWDWSAYDLEINATGVAVTDDILTVSWPDGHVSTFDADYLRRRRYDDAARTERRPQLDLWSAEDIVRRTPNVDHAAVMADDNALLDLLIKVRDTGFAIVRNMPNCDRPDTDWPCETVARRIAFTRETNFGRRFDVISKPDPNNQAYTHDALLAHTDLANREMPPGVQFLHCLEFAAEGGESLLVDGFHAAEELRADDPGAWTVLTTMPVAFRFHDSDWDVRWSGPVIALDVDGGYHEIRYNPGIAAPIDVPFALVKPLYRALTAYAARLKDPRNVLAFKLRPGDMMVFNNRRVLHGRGAFDPSTGPRHLQGCYVDLDEWHSRIRVLQGEHRLD
ncbi:MAG: TauD/TfdA family dioxygenase [Alphaproteobacteria bacterium]|nr:TauD/TfdA family dioxygenase [Alphaproteobacteria bacterium]